MINRLKKHMTYWIFPSIVISICLIVYIFNILGLSYIIAPEINREFGLVENIQLTVILTTLIFSYKTYKTVKVKFLKYVFLSVSLLSIFMLLEEIDYGIHFYYYFFSNPSIQNTFKPSQPINIHNQGNLLHYIKLSVYLSFVCFLAVLPIIIRIKKIKFSNQYINWLMPSKYFPYSLVSMLVLNKIALYLDKTVKDNHITSLNSNMSEFEEIFIYYIMLLYVLELIHRNTLVQEKEL